MTVNVVLPLPLDQVFSYAVPPALEADARPGCRVLVPFRGRRLTGVITGEGPDPDDVDFRLRPIDDVLDERPTCPPELLRLTRWIADYYVCSWGEALKAALPAGFTVQTERRLALGDAEAAAWPDTEEAQSVRRDLAEHDSTTLSALRKRLGMAVSLQRIRSWADADLVRLTTTLSDPSVSPKTETHLRLAGPFQSRSGARDAAESLRGDKQKAVVRTLATAHEKRRAPVRQADLVDALDAPYSTIHSLVEKGIVERTEERVHRSPLSDLPPPGDPPNHTLHPAQQEALDALEAEIADASYHTFLLHGITGSGKTEVYIAALKQVVAAGRSAIILVPEIALTPQTVQRFRAHVGDTVAVLHSQMSAGERFDTWQALRDGRKQIVIGPRSAVLAPLDNLGLIVVDEEHEASYKQFDPAPRYHARDVAVMRAHMNDAVCVLGSATPSLESTMNARRGKYTRLSMPDRVPTSDGTVAQLPEVEILDLTKQRKKHQLNGPLSDPMLEAIQTRIEREEQVLLLQNRRGYAPVIECADCGWVPYCTDCSVSLTEHSHGRQLRCHYCGHTRGMPSCCPSCGSDDLQRIGTGTQRVEEMLSRELPSATVLRMDRDTTRQKGAHHALLSAFREEGDILLGTQMIAKGLDFARVTLVGVVDADVGMLFPDFRAEERTFQLLTQVAGRAGRADLAGTVLLQTRNPDHAALRFAQTHDYENFAAHALEERKALRYPPFGNVASVEFRAPDQDDAQRLATDWTRHLQEHGGSIDILGPNPAFIQRVQRYFRYRTILKTTAGPRILQRALRHARDAYGSPPANHYVSIDMDALDLL